MKKIVLLLLIILSSQVGECTLVNNDINIFNLKSDSMYILDIDSPVKNINISNKDIVNLTPITSVDNEKKQLFVETNKDGDYGVNKKIFTKEMRKNYTIL